MYILSIDTSTRFCSVALHNGGKELCTLTLQAERSSSSLLTTLIQSVADLAGIGLAAIDAFAVAKGPGSYTGLRVGAATAKGLCFALDKPLLAVGTLKAMALQVNQVQPRTAFSIENPALEEEASFYFVPMLDARRMEVYCSVYNERMEEIQEVQPVIVTGESFAGLLERHRLVFFGDGAAKCMPLLGNHPNAHFLKADILPLASAVGQLAGDLYSREIFEDPVTFEPFYLKAFMAKAPRTLLS